MASRLITSSDNTFFKLVKKLTNRKYRLKEGLFIAEGIKIVEENTEYSALIINQERESELSSFLIDKEYFVVPKHLFSEISSQENSQGILGIYKIPEEKSCFESNNVIVLDKLQDPGNIGTTIRTADAAGFNDIVLLDGCSDIFNEKCVRSSMGSIFRINFFYKSQEEFLSFAKLNNYSIISTALDEDSINYTQIKLDNKNFIVFGNEGNGISKEILSKSSQKIIIPILGKAESLNVSIACAIILYKIREIIN